MEQYRPSIAGMKEKAPKKTAESQERKAKRSKKRAALGLAALALTGAAAAGVKAHYAPSGPEDTSRIPEKTATKLPGAEDQKRMDAQDPEDISRVKKGLEPKEAILPEADATGEQTKGFH